MLELFIFKAYIKCSFFYEAVNFPSWNKLLVPTDSYKRVAPALKTIFISLWLVSHWPESGSVLPQTERSKSKARVALITEARHPHRSGGDAPTRLQRGGAGPAYLFLDCLVALLQPAPPPSHVLPVEEDTFGSPAVRLLPAQYSGLNFPLRSSLAG